MGEKDGSGNRDGYLHLCGKIFWKHHAELMLNIYELAERTITDYDASVGAIGA